MAAALLGHPRPQYTLDSGAINAGGELLFYITGTLIAKNVYSDAALGTSLGASVTLDAAGRTPDPIFGDGVYRVVEMGANGAQVNSTDGVNIQGAPAITFPDPADGNEDDVLGTDGVNYLFRPIREVPSVVGQSGKYLGNDGELPQWTAFPAAVVYDEDNLPGGVTTTPGSIIRVGNEVLIKGTGTCPTSATTASTVSVDFGFTFASAPEVWCTAKVGAVTGENARCSMQALSASTTGFTASAFAGAEDGGGALNISTAVPFSWMAWGTAP